MSIDHYENFPVGSILLPRRMRKSVHIVYQFARYADDIADEGDASNEERLSRLNELEQQLRLIEAHETPSMPLMQALASVIHQHQLSTEPFLSLLSAFKQDVETKRYQNFASLVDYCRRSANPVGRIMLNLYGQTDTKCLAQSDGICTALQLINFWQDVQIDWKMGRVYIPQDDLLRFEVSERFFDLQNVEQLAAFKSLMRFEVNRARKMLQAGAPLGLKLKGRFGLEVRMIIMGANRVLEKLHNHPERILKERLHLTWRDWVVMFVRACLKR